MTIECRNRERSARNLPSSLFIKDRPQHSSASLLSIYFRRCLRSAWMFIASAPKLLPWTKKTRPRSSLIQSHILMASDWSTWAIDEARSNLDSQQWHVYQGRWLPAGDCEYNTRRIPRRQFSTSAALIRYLDSQSNKSLKDQDDNAENEEEVGNITGQLENLHSPQAANHPIRNPFRSESSVGYIRNPFLSESSLALREFGNAIRRPAAPTGHSRQTQEHL